MQDLLPTRVLLHPSDVAVTTKVGYVVTRPGATRLPALSGSRVSHSYDPAFLRAEIKHSCAALAPCRIACLYLHNPEVQTGRSLEQRLAKAFEVCEEARQEGTISSFGIASWHGLASTGSQARLLTVEGIDDLAISVGGVTHGLRSLQMPISLIRSETAGEALAGGGPIRAAADRGWSIYGSSPLHAGALPAMLTREFLGMFPAGVSPAQACLLFAASVPGITAVLTSCSTKEHLRDALEVASTPLLTQSDVKRILELVK